MRIAIDVMGGDNGPQCIIDGVNLFYKKNPSVSFLLCGDATVIKDHIAHNKTLQSVCTIEHTTDDVSADDKPSIALRRMRSSSMAVALEAVADGRCVAAVSAGNTGAYLALSKNILKTQGTIDRPAIAGLFPTEKGHCVMLDLGGSLEASSRNLCEFALMGSVFASKTLNVSNPSVGLLNVGKEASKGNDRLKQAFQYLNNSNINFVGFIEGNDIAQGGASVVITDGFTGNVALKMAEGMSSLMRNVLKNSAQSSVLRRASSMFSKPLLRHAYEKIDAQSHNGAIWLGLNGIAIKSHGNATAYGFASAIQKAHDMHRTNVIHEVEQAILDYDGLAIDA